MDNQPKEHDMQLTIWPFPSPDGVLIKDGVSGPTVARIYGDDYRTQVAGAKSICLRYNAHQELVAALETALATIQLHTGNGCQNPDALVKAADGEVDYEATASRLTAVLAGVKGE
jgi:hypothetical protein